MIIAICGKSGAGKTTLREALVKQDKSLTKAMSYTTRPIRPGEKVGDDYYFIDEKTYHNDMDFIITRQAGQYLYGMTNETLKHENTLFIIDIGGMKQLRQHTDFNVVFIDPPKDVLVSRLLQRGDDIETINKRLEIDKEFSLDTIQKIVKPENILHITNGSVSEVFNTVQTYINKQRMTEYMLKNHGKERG